MRLLVVAALFAFHLPFAASACTKPPGDSSLEASMVQWINQQREGHGLPALRPSGKLRKAAEQHACDMARHGYFGHQRAGGPELGDRVKANGYRYRHVAENIALSRRPSVSEAAALWQQSSPHWRNLLKPNVREIGLAVASRGNDTFWVMNVGNPR